ncbi:MAG TPA: protein kinase [Polyangiales bacterium]|nr:protein kinase [Polyangiales bacterium]
MVRADRPVGRQPELSEIVAGRYRLSRKLARGGMGEVFAALDQSTGKKVALKRMLPAAREQRSMVVHFMREYHALAELRHPRIIEVFDYGVDRNVPYYTMELLDGQDLRDLSPLPYREACAHLRDVASSLALLHARRLLHRDVSPRNVRRTSDGRCKLLDFGAMMPFGIPANVTGTAPCVPPEALQGAPLDQRSDLYALGALAYCLLTGRHGYTVSEFDELPAAWKQALVRPKRRVRDLPDALDQLVMSLMSLDPMKRPGSAAEVIDWLSAIGELPPDDGAAAARSFLTSSHIWGRDKERVELSRRLSKALTGEGSALLITGELGAGKSRMLAEAALVAQTCGLTVVRLIARKQRGAAAALISDLVVGLRQAAPVEAQRAAAKRPHVLAQLQRTPGDTGQLAVDSGETRRQILTQVTEYVREVARERPLLVTVDDLHRADEFSGALIAAIAHQTRNSPHVVIAAHTAEPSEQSMSAIASLAHTLELEALERKHSDLLVASLFGDVPNLDRVSDWLYRTALGNPKLTLELAEHLMNRGVVSYVGGIWVLPSDEITEPVPHGLAETMMLRVAGCSPAALALAELCCVRRGGVSAEHCLALVAEPADQVFRALEELVRAGVLETAGSEYVFAQETLRKALQRSLSAERSQELHARWADRLLAERPSSLDTRLEAGWHLVHTRDELRGADLLAKVGPELVNKRVGLATAIPAIEKALAVYERHDRPRSARLHLRAMLVMCGYLFDYKLASRYGPEALDALYESSGLRDIGRISKRVGNFLGFGLGMIVAHVRWLFSSPRSRGPNPVASMVYFIRSAMGLLGVRGVAIDVEGTLAIYERMRLFQGSPLPVMRMLHVMAKSITLLNQGRESEAYNTVQEAIARMAKPALGMSAQEHTDLLAGALLLAGLTECYREHSKGLDYARRLEAIGTPLAVAASQRLMITYHLLRGDRERTQYYRRLLDLHAIQGSTTWQVEWFSVPLEGMAGAAWTDLIMLRRSIDRLERLVHEVPSMGAMRDGIRVAYHFRRGEYAQAAALGTAYIAQHPPRSIIGWATAYGITALSLVEIDEPEQALLLTERGLAAVSDEDRSYFVLYAILEVAHATALAVLGHRERADEIFRVRLARMRACGEHMRAFIIHEYRTKVARLIGDREALIAAIKDMREAALASGNPTVIALADRVTELRARQRSSPLPPAQQELQAPPPAATVAPPAPRKAIERTAVSVFLRECREPGLRAQHALTMLGQYASTNEGFLYWVSGENLTLAAALDDAPPSAALEVEMIALLPKAEEVSFVELFDVQGKTRRYRVFRLSGETAEEGVVGLVALRETDSAVEDVPRSLVDEIGKVLRAGPTGLTQHPSAFPKG